MDLTLNDQRQRFELAVDGEIAFIDYRLDGNKLTLVHTEVPEALEGRGVGGKIVKLALAYARANALTVIPECAFVRSYLERHPEERDVVAV
jgi:uncharacterized protein